MWCRLIYCSERSPSCSDADISGLVAKSALSNRSADISGLLLVDDTIFAQMLEGERRAVTSLFLRLAADRRHSGITLIECVDIDERLCPDWGMIEVSKARTPDAWRSIGLFNGEDPRTWSADLIARAIATARSAVDIDFVDAA
jgi:blue light- and temperature-responsive anti-repressor